jgi:succinate dehydrogenase/fumarate reductase flavoprotein subunit
MATDHHVDAHGLNRQRSVDECLAFGQAAGTGRKVDRIRAKSASGEAKTGTSSGGVFEEQISNDDAFQHIQSLSSAEGGSIIVFREIQNGGQLFG